MDWMVKKCKYIHFGKGIQKATFQHEDCVNSLQGTWSRENR